MTILIEKNTTQKGKEQETDISYRISLISDQVEISVNMGWNQIKLYIYSLHIMIYHIINPSHPEYSIEHLT